MRRPACPGTPVPQKWCQEHGQARDERKEPWVGRGTGRGTRGHARAQDSPQTCHLNANLEAPLQAPQGLCVFRRSLSPHFLQPHPQLTQSFPEQPGR